MAKENKNILVRKIKLKVVGEKEERDRVYKYLRDGQDSYACALNLCMSKRYALAQNKVDFKSDEYKAEMNKFGRKPGSNKGSAYTGLIEEDKVPTGLPCIGGVPHVTSPLFTKALKEGLMYGRVSLPTFRNSIPLPVPKMYVSVRGTVERTGKNAKGMEDNGLYYDKEDYETDELFHQALIDDREVKVYLKFANGIKFKLVFGNVKNSGELRASISKVFAGIYSPADSSIGVNNDGEIILNMCIDAGADKLVNDLDEDVCVGVDLGIAIPAFCAVNNNDYARKGIGSADDFIRVRGKIKALKRRHQSNLRFCNGGHGRKKKLRSMDNFRCYEKNWAKTYNHKVAREVVQFALSQKAKYINLENLTGITNKENRFLKDWSYFDLQTNIENLSKQYGIVVRKINPAYTSQTCSYCGNLEEGQRVSQDKFVCKCCGEELNADWNAARNISRSEDFIDNKAAKKQAKQMKAKSKVKSSKKKDKKVA